MEYLAVMENKGHNYQSLQVTDSALMNEAAFNDWIVSTQKSLVRFCRQIVGDWSEAEDMAQEAYIRAWQKRGMFKGESSLLTWQMSIARRVCLDHLRRSKRTNMVLFEECEASTEQDIDLVIDVQNALKKLDANDRILLYMRIGEEMTFDDISQVLGKSPVTCRKRFERVKKKFENTYNGRKE